MEMVWRPSTSLGAQAEIFTGVLFTGYGPPPGLCFDTFCTDPPIQVTVLHHHDVIINSLQLYTHMYFLFLPFCISSLFVPPSPPSFLRLPPSFSPIITPLILPFHHSLIPSFPTSQLFVSSPPSLHLHPSLCLSLLPPTIPPFSPFLHFSIHLSLPLFLCYSNSSFLQSFFLPHPNLFSFHHFLYISPPTLSPLLLSLLLLSPLLPLSFPFSLPSLFLLLSLFQDDPNLFDYNVKERVATFNRDAITQASKYATNHIMFTMGSDFQYKNAREWYKNLDKLLHYVNEQGVSSVFYNSFSGSPFLIPDYPHSHSRLSSFSFQTIPFLIPDYPLSHSRLSPFSFQTIPFLIPDYPLSHSQTIPILIPRLSPFSFPDYPLSLSRLSSFSFQTILFLIPRLSSFSFQTIPFLIPN